LGALGLKANFIISGESGKFRTAALGGSFFS
jgi:hypothetical protein